MSKLEELIQRYCPDGVEFIKLGEVLTVNRGKRLTKSQLSDDGQYYVYHGSKDTPLGKYSHFNVKKNTTIVVNTGGIGGVKFCSDDFWCSDGSFWIGHSDRLNDKYVYYYLSPLEPFFASQKRVGGVPTIDRSVVENVEIPIPPLLVQEEIVRVLDTFAELQTELQTELQKRLQQYNYYRDNLLSFEGRTDVEWVTIEQLFHRKNGYTPSRANPDFWTDGTIPWFRMEDIRENGRILTNSIQKVHPSAVKKNSLVKAGSIILATSATIGEHALANVDCLTNQRFTCLTVKEDYNHKVDIKFIFYYMFKVDEWCKTHTVQGNFPGVDMSLFPNVSIPLPTLDEQKRIASILDRFDAMTTDLTAGLPAEIEKRRQQYEYYRNRLLTFKRAN